MNGELHLNSRRARKARLAALIGRRGRLTLGVGLVLFGGGAAALFLFSAGHRNGYFSLAIGLLFGILLIWYDQDLKSLPPLSPAGSLDDILEPGLLASFSKKAKLTPRSVWMSAVSTWQARFLAEHLLLNPQSIAQNLSDEPSELPAVWLQAHQLSEAADNQQLNGAALGAALITSSLPAKNYLASLNLRPEDVLEAEAWQQRLERFFSRPKPYFGGIGRDWAAGFTPTLDRYGRNISREVEAGHGHFHTLAHADILDPIIHDLSQGAGLTALIGEAGTGKTALTYALATRLLEGRDEKLLYYQIVSLDASAILSSSGKELEKIMLTLLGEATAAGNIILFLDEARLFFGSGTGAFDASQILMPLVQNRRLKLLAAFTPDDFQHLKSSNSSLASAFATVAVSQPDPVVTMRILEDSALTFAQRDDVLISYQAVREAYRLSGQYMQELAYPGKAISLLEQAIPYAKDKLLDAETVQTAVEKAQGVKVAKADAPEADTLLHLEDRIHDRMINQERAVKVVAAALRRERAGVASPNRPAGSFLFLGPTGVGKTELARSLAATYFGDERQMIRLDMSEYQQTQDVSRLLAVGEADEKSLILHIREQPFSVVLLDEVEKAHPSILNLLLQMLDEGQLTDQNGRPASFKNALIIATSNAGSAEITQRVAAGDSLETFEKPLIDQLISQGLFKAELVNRFDEIVLFRPLNQAELAQVAKLMLGEVNKTLASQNVSVQLTEAALNQVVSAGYDPQFGARPMRRVIQKMVEDTVATRILSGTAAPGSVITLDVNDLSDNQ